MKKLNFLLLFLASFQLGHAQFIFSQYFDGKNLSPDSSLLIHIPADSSNSWQIAAPRKDFFTRAATIPNAILTDNISAYPHGDSSVFELILPDPNWFGLFALQWIQKIDFDSTDDGGIVEYSLNNGQSWESVFDNPYVYNFYGFDPQNVDTFSDGRYAFKGRDTSWKNVWLCFDSWFISNSYDTLRFRFTMISDSLGQRGEGWMIDNFISQITIVHTVEGKELPEYLNIGPNPTTGRLFIEAERKEGINKIEELKLTDLNGRVLQHFHDIPIKFFIDLYPYPAGKYELYIRTNHEEKNFSVILQK